MKAIGMIETKGLVASIESADIMLKTADVKLISKTIVGGGLVTITVEGDVAAVKASVDAAVSAVERLGKQLLVSNHVIPRPVDDISSFFKKENEMETEEKDTNLVEDGCKIEEDVVKDTLEQNGQVEVEEQTLVNIEMAEDEAQEKFKIDQLDKKNFKREDFEKINKDFDKQTSLKVLESLSLSDLRRLTREYGDHTKGLNISKLSKSKLIDEIMNIVE